MFVSQSMTREVITINKDADIFEAKDKMTKHHIRHLPVVGKDNRIIGIVSDRDIRSALPCSLLKDYDTGKTREKLLEFKIKDIMRIDPFTVSLSYTIQDTLLLMQKTQVGAFPVVDKQGRIKGIVSTRDLLRSFINVLGIGEPGTLLCIIAEEKIGQLKKIVDAITEENISFGSVLVARYWDEGKRAIFPYLLTKKVGHVKRKLKKMGYTLLDPSEWDIDQISQNK
ncbi:MAG: CBS domain-containing protein [Desulfobacteraceae bacterium]|nr:CBS domain-containing protein [Desulfobacteraceae bacterium]MBC2718798.1 CBS domain-containing protein [Desulfobacteraceae bacterium]